MKKQSGPPGRKASATRGTAASHRTAARPRTALSRRALASRKNPPIRSMFALRAIATAFTLLSFGGMTVYAADHAKPANATLAPTVISAAAPRPSPPARLRLSPQIPVTRLPPVTSTSVS